MKGTLTILLAVFFTTMLYGQHAITLSVETSAGEPLAGSTAAISFKHKMAIADSTGRIEFADVPPGDYVIRVSYTGFVEKNIKVRVPQSLNTPLRVILEENTEHEEEVIITATRTSRGIKDIPTRVETISGEELAEKGNMKPGDIRMMLNESTGIQTQQTSATSYNSSIRIQGLDGRYTQLLRDGLPLYAGFSGGLSLMQIAPLDLKQVEVIKGSSSTLYGAGAIAGLVNLVSKVPEDERELSFIANATSARGLDLSGFYSQKFTNTGITVFGSRNTGNAYDPAGISFTAIPEFERYTINPRFFIYGKKSNADIGVSYITENRTGGSMDYIKNGTPGYFEKNHTNRFTSRVSAEHTLNSNSSLHFKSSYTSFNRKISLPNYIFEGRQESSYSELNLDIKRDKTFWIVGIDIITDDFNEKNHGSPFLRNYHQNTVGAFIQNTWSASGNLTIETGIRGDYITEYGFEFLPRISAMLKISSKLTTRLGGGLGYKTPTVFNEEAEKMHFQDILPINQLRVKNERSTGANLDFNYRTRIGETGITINQLFFFTKLDKPLLLTETGNSLAFTNAAGYMDTKGIETNLRLTFRDFKLFIGYTYADVKTHFNGAASWFPLTSRHRLNNVLMYEKEDKLKVGFEAYYFSSQKLNDGKRGKPYWLNGLMAEKLWKTFSVFINFENIFDTRQTRFDTIYTGSVNDPVFRDIYAPVDGFVINGGVKLRL